MRRLILLPLVAAVLLVGCEKPICDKTDSIWDDCRGQRGAYIGEFKDNKFHGQGTWYYKDGGILYQGEHKDGMHHGQGTLYNKDGSIDYRGEFCAGAARPCQ